MWFNKKDDRALFIDVRAETHTYGNGTGERYVSKIEPDRIADFRDMPFGDNTFHLVVFDPPHLLERSAGCDMANRYGVLCGDWRDVLRAGFKECFRVLKPNGVLVFKWNEYAIRVSEILALTEERPLFGNRYGKTGKSHWIVFLKPNKAICFADDDLRTEGGEQGGEP